MLRNFNLWGICALVLTGCAPAASGVIRLPELQLKDSKVSMNAELSYVLQVQLTNPNPFPLHLKNISGQWILNGKISHALKLPDLVLPPSGNLSYNLNTTGPIPDGFKTDKTHTFRFDGGYLLEAQGKQTTLQEYTLWQGAFRLP
ncbi:hypothetical protein [Deinococcus misasensis]|uniref:hypothetical protein n=1 Tax=Deinococcus misasensis TaxID=392413 RepID=UPI000550BC20|nr:hypothetical protein [Deinococcus misasensis]